jgi:hypothetical protein
MAFDAETVGLATEVDIEMELAHIYMVEAKGRDHVGVSRTLRIASCVGSGCAPDGRAWLFARGENAPCLH